MPDPIIPGMVPGTTPPFLPSGSDQQSLVDFNHPMNIPGQAAAPTDDKTKALLAMIMKAAAQKQFAGQPRPAQVPGQESTEPPSYMKGPSWGPERFMYTLQHSISNAANQRKQNQITRAMADYDIMGKYTNELYAAQQSGDPKAIQAAQAKIDAQFSGPGGEKRLKEMAKALNQDWLNPEKTTVFGEASKKYTAQLAQETAAKSKAAQGIQGIFNKMKALIGKQPGTAGNVPLTPDQQKQMMGEIQAKAPVTTPAMTGTTAKDILEVAQASKAMREQYDHVVAADGKVWAINKENPKDAFVIKDSASGEAVTGQTKASAAPKVLSIQGVPYGIQRGKDIVTPDSEGWTKDDQKTFDAALHAADVKKQLRIDPIIADQIGDAPDPKNFAKGKNDPKYGEALKQYGLEAERIKTRMAGSQAGARGMAYGQYRPVQAINPATGNVEYMFAKDAIASGAAGASEGTRLMSKDAQISDIQTASGYLRDSIKKLDRPFDAQQIAKLTLALQSQDENVARTELQTLAGSQELTPAQQDFVIWVNQINERAMSLRSIAGQGQGAQDLRNAVRNMLPGVRSGSQEMALKQLDAFDQQVKILKSGIPGVKKKTDTTGTGGWVLDPDGIYRKH
jgi:hypothetical protein